MFQFLNVKEKKRKLSKNIEERECFDDNFLSPKKPNPSVSEFAFFITVWWR